MNELQKFIDLSRQLGQRPDFVQGTGGNVSIKIDNQKMLIKASGWRLSDIDENNGLVEVNLSQKNNENFTLKKTQNLRPSIEVDFHAFLDKFVIHTHSVYVNIIACVLNGKSLWEEIPKDFNFRAAWVEYNSPGEHLASAIKKVVNEYKKKYNKMPEAILMQNHGLIVSGENLDRVFNLHNGIQEIIKKKFNLKPFPENLDDYLKEFIKNNENFIADLSKNILFPDQAVFCGDISEKISIDEKTGNIIYKTGEKKALAIKENLAALAYIFSCAKDCGLVLKFLSLEEIDYIKNMESEKYRQQLLNK